MGLSLAAVLAMTAGAQDASTPQFYSTKVQPILQQHCYQCHDAAKHSGGLNMESRAGFLNENAVLGPPIAPGDPANSLLVTLIKQTAPPAYAPPMPPPPNPKLSDADIATIEQWIKTGAIMPAQVGKSAAPADPAKN